MDKLICVGKNYLEHAKELGDKVPEKPVLFLKPPSVVKVVPQHKSSIVVKLPQVEFGTVHHELEILFKLNSSGKFFEVTLGLDMTLRDLQNQLKKQGHPWEISKVFRESAIVGPWVKISGFPTYMDEEFTFALDGVMRQRGKGRDMKFSPEECIAYADKHFPICDGDILFTGTPVGVGPVTPGQVGEIRWGDHLQFQVKFL